MRFEKLQRFLHTKIHPFEHLSYGAIITLIVFGLIKLDLFVVFLTTPKLRWSAIVTSFIVTVIASFYYERNVLKIAKRVKDWV